jgi:hypothetical protein
MRHLNIYSNDFTETLQGGISVHEDLLRWRRNGSIYEFINLPDQKGFETCVRVTTAFRP